MNIPVGDYILKSDRWNLYICKIKKVKKKDGSEGIRESRVTGYCTSWRELMQSFARTGLKQSDAETMRQLMADVKKLADDAVMLGIAARENDFRKDGQDGR